MCCLFGLIDVSRNFTAKEKSHILNILATACEVRGTDATGIAYNSLGKMRVYKRPLPAHLMHFRIPESTKVVMGHTRMTTQGAAERSCNNHPFLCQLPNQHFALAHNGILYNDRDLRQSLALPKTKIETDSYIAVQLIEKQKTLDFDSLCYMAEQVEGSFTFTVLDDTDQLYIIKGSNPICLHHFPNENFYLYASTKEILDLALQATHLHHLEHDRVPVNGGEILKITRTGEISRETFTMKRDVLPWYYPRFHFPTITPAHKKSEYRDQLLEFGIELGVSPAELDYLNRMGLSDQDLENTIFDDGFRIECLMDLGYYDEEDLYHERIAGYVW